MREFGGVIKPRTAQALAIPIHPSAKNKLPGDFDDLTLIQRKGKNPLLVRKQGKGRKHERLEIMFVLTKKVIQKAANEGRGFMRPGARKAELTIRAKGL